MKKILSAIALTFLALPMLVLAAPTIPGQIAGSGLTGSTSVADILGNLLKWGLGILLILGVLAFVVAGILYVTAAGDENRIKTAKSVMVFAIVGVIVGLIGYIAVNTITGMMEGGGVAF